MTKYIEHISFLFFISSGISIIYFGFIITGFFSSTLTSSLISSFCSFDSSFAFFASFLPLPFFLSVFLLLAGGFFPEGFLLSGLLVTGLLFDSVLILPNLDDYVLFFNFQKLSCCQQSVLLYSPSISQ
jgi:hypothetical protein